MRRLIVLVVGLGLVAGGIMLLRLRSDDTTVLPKAISSQVSFVSFVPTKDYAIPDNGVTFKEGILSIVAVRNTTRISLNEQALPDVFTDVPQYYPTLLDRLNRYAVISTVHGTAYATHPSELGGRQQVILNASGSLVFMSPNHNLSSDDWRRFINQLATVNP